MNDDCVVCGGANDSQTGLNYCRNCAKEIWSTAVVARFIEQIVDLTDRLTEAHQIIHNLRHRIKELEKPH